MSLTSDELNFIVYRYLLESGFTHTAFSLGHEAHISKSSLNSDKLPAGTLVSFVQKGLRYDEIEAHVSEDGSEIVCDAPFSIVKPHVCNVIETKRVFDPDTPIQDDFGALEIDRDRVQTIPGHQGMVCACRWGKDDNQLASASTDGSARLWNVSEEVEESAVLRIPDHSEGPSSIITGLSWNPQGSMIVSSSLAGELALWNSSGKLSVAVSGHSGPVTRTAWNSAGDRLISCGADKKAIVWNRSLEPVCKITDHKDAVYDADWKNDTIVATASADGNVVVYDVSSDSRLDVFEEEAAVNCCRWSQNGEYLATGSENSTVKVWKMGSDEPVQSLEGHGRSVSYLSWGGFLASASFDTTVRLWDVETATSVHNLSRHIHPVSLVEYSPDERYVCSAAHDRLYIWSPKTGSLLRTLRCAGGVNDFSWCPDSKRVSIATANNTLAILDLRI